MSNETHDTENNQQTDKGAETQKKESGEPKGCHACPDCAHAKENKKPCKRLKWKFSMKWWVFALVAFACVGGIIAPFIAQYLAPRKSALEVALSAWNQYVSIILGIVATLLSIVSLVFSFHNEEEENIQQRDYDKRFSEITHTLLVITKDVATLNDNVNKVNDNVSKVKEDLSLMDKSLMSIKIKLQVETVESVSPEVSVDRSNITE